MRGVDAEAFRALFRAVPTPVGMVAVRTSGVDAGASVHATTVSSFCSLSLEPPLLLVALQRDTAILALVHQQGAFGLSVLAHDQAELARRGAQRGAGALPSQAWHDDGGLPRLNGAIAWAGCEVTEYVPGGDHEIVLGQVIATHVQAGSPLVHQMRAYHQLASDERG